MSYTRNRFFIFPQTPSGTIYAPQSERVSGEASGRATRWIPMSSDKTPSSDFVVTDRRSGDRGDRRHQNDRRKRSIPVAVDRRSGADRRQGERRRQVDPTTCEKDY